MELKSNYFNIHMNDNCSDILTQSMLEMITELSSNAIFVMNTEIETAVGARMSVTIVDILKNQRYKFMPFYMVCEGFARGSMGELGGTTRFTVRNVCTWLNAMYEKLAQINTEFKTKEDAERRAREARDFKHEQKTANLYGAAMYRKIGWAVAGALNSADYDRCTLDKIVEKIREGYSVKELQPSMIL